MFTLSNAGRHPAITHGQYSKLIDQEEMITVEFNCGWMNNGQFENLGADHVNLTGTDRDAFLQALAKTIIAGGAKMDAVESFLQSALAPR